MQAHTVVLNSYYECAIDGELFRVTIVGDNVGNTYYAVTNLRYNFEKTIEDKFKIKQKDIYDCHYLSNRKIIYYNDENDENRYAMVAYENRTDAIDYLLIILRKLMTLCVDIKVVGLGDRYSKDRDECFRQRLKNLGLTIIPYGCELLLHPDTEAFRDEATHDYDDVIDTDEPYVNITIRKKKQLKLDFH